jgi:hypothetical protein
METKIKNISILVLVTMFIGWGNLFINPNLIGKDNPIFSLFVFGCIAIGSYNFGVLLRLMKNNSK